MLTRKFLIDWNWFRMPIVEEAKIAIKFVIKTCGGLAQMIHLGLIVPPKEEEVKVKV